VIESHDVVATAETLHEMDVDDLLKYINGDEDKSQAKMSTRKAAKRARQKQRKVPSLIADNRNRERYRLLLLITETEKGTVSYC